MNSKKLILKLAVLVLGLATLRVAAIPAKATPICVFKLCNAGGGGHCGYAPREDWASATRMTDPRYPIPKNVVGNFQMTH